MLGRIVQSKALPSSKVLATKNDKLTYLRTRFYEDPERFTSVDEMTDFVGLSRSGLQHLYKKTFGITLIDDVIAGRLENAKAPSTPGQTHYKDINTSKEKCYQSRYEFKNLVSDGIASKKLQ